MHRFKIGLLLSCIVMLTACGSNANLSESTEPEHPEEYSAAKNSDNNTVESDGDDDTGNLSGTAQADDKTEDTTDAAQLNDISEDLAETSQPNDSTENSSESTENDESDEIDTVYLKPCYTYQDILDNVYEVIVNRRAYIVVAGEQFCYAGIWEAGIGRSTDELLAGIGYTFYDVDGNGIEELIIADTGESVWDNRILLMYSLFDDMPVFLIDGCDRDRWYLLNDDTFYNVYNEESGGAVYTTFANYRMAEGGHSLRAIDYYFSDYRDDLSEEYWLVEGNWGWFHNTTGAYKKDESDWMEFENEDVPWEMMENYLAQVKQLDLTFFETLRQ